MIPGGILSNKIGRRGVHLFSLPFLILGLLIVGFAQNKIMLFAGRLISCSAVCLYMPSIGVYISEIVHPNIRATLVGFGPFFLALGYMLVWMTGYFLWVISGSIRD